MREQRQCGARAQPLGKRLDQRKFGQGVACPLQKQHGYLHLEKVRASIDRRAPGWMQRKAEKDQTADVRKRHCRLCLRGHAAAKGFAAGEQGQCGGELMCFCNNRAYGGVAERGRVGPFTMTFRVGKLKAQCGDADGREVSGHSGHEWMVHAGPGSMGKHEARFRRGRLLHQTGHADLLVNRNRQPFWIGRCHSASMPGDAVSWRQSPFRLDGGGKRGPRRSLVDCGAAMFLSD